MSLRPIRTATIWTASALLLLGLITVFISVYFPALSRLDWGFYKALLIGGSFVAYGLFWFRTKRTPFYWLAILCLKAEAHQQQFLEILQEAADEYKRRRPATELALRGEIGGLASDQLELLRESRQQIAA